jgi:hypothetical protein
MCVEYAPLKEAIYFFLAGIDDIMWRLHRIGISVPFPF